MDHCEGHKEFTEKIDKKLDTIILRLGKGDVSLATLALRIRLMEVVVYGSLVTFLATQFKSLLAG